MRTTSSNPVRAVIFGHGDFPQSLLATLQAIAGDVPGIIVLSNKGISRTEMETRLKEILDAAPLPTIIFVDLFGGSCPMVCGVFKRERKNIAVICGVNLPMLLEFAFAREKMKFAELVNHVVQVGKEGIRTV